MGLHSSVYYFFTQAWQRDVNVFKIEYSTYSHKNDDGQEIGNLLTVIDFRLDCKPLCQKTTETLRPTGLMTSLFMLLHQNYSVFDPAE